MTKDSNTTVKGYKNAVQSIGYAAAYPAYPLNPPLATVLRLSVACRRRCTGCIAAKRCVLEQKLLLTTYRKSYMTNLLPK